MRQLATALICALIFTTSVSQAADKIIVDGFNDWAKGGSTAAFNTWAKGGPLDGSKEIMAQASQFGQISTYYGKYTGFEIMDESIIGKNSKVVYAMLNLELGALFGRFILYRKTNGEWVSSNFKFHTDLDAIWPHELVLKYIRK